MHGQIELLHACIPGRMRARVEGVTGWENVLGSLVSAHSDVKEVRISRVTGSIVIRFAPTTSTQDIIDHLRSCLESAREGKRSGHGAEWHTQTVSGVAERLGTSVADGLSYRKAASRLVEHGPNKLISSPPRSRGEILANQFSGAPVAMLAGVAAYSLFMGAIGEAVAVGAVLAINAVIGFATEAKAEATISSLTGSEVSMARVMREGTEERVDANTLVPGDIILVERGDVVPADARLAVAQDLSVSEAALTGESLPVRKGTNRLAEPSLPLADRTNMIYRGTILVSGRGRAIVVETGADTEIGRVQSLASASRPPETPSHVQLETLGYKFAWIAGGASALLLAIGLLRGRGALTMVRSALTLVVASVPEGLPMIATTCHALGVEAMRKKNVIVRRPDALETLASVDVVCLDKTGTLTENHMSVAEIVCGNAHITSADGYFVALAAGTAREAVAHLLRVASLCNEVEINGSGSAISFYGSATESALLSAALQWGIKVRQLREENPRQWIREWTGVSRFMVSLHDGSSGPFLAIKGAPGEVLRRCTEERLEDGTTRPLTPVRRDEIERQKDDMAGRGLRVLGFACANKSAVPGETKNAVTGLSWIGMVGLADPIRESAADAIRDLQRAGIWPIMITGDQLLTARAIAEQVGIENGGKFVDGADLDKLSLEELARVAKTANVLARVTPAQKLRVVEALQRSGSVVAMVGDGTNDSPALRRADVGIALTTPENATAREVADIVLRTNNLRVLADAIKQGRTTYANVRKALRFLLGTNSSEVLLMLGGTAAGVREVLNPLQLLWINLITDVGPGIGLAVEAPHPSVMVQQPRSRQAPLLDAGEAGTLIRDGSLLASAGVASGLYGALRYGIDSRQTQTLTFASLVSAQLFHALNCRDNMGFDANRRPNLPLNLILAGTAAAQSATLFLPGLRRLLGLTPLGRVDTAVITGASVLPFLARRFLAMGRKRAPASG